MTRVSGAKGSKKSLRSKPSFLQPRRLSEESKRDHTTDTEVPIYICTHECMCRARMWCTTAVQPALPLI